MEQPLKVKAAVLKRAGAPLEIGDVVLPAPDPGQVRVRLHAVGVCHSDLSLANGTLEQPTPAILGHEAAGTVSAVGDPNSRIKVGDPVLLNWSPACRACWFCQHQQPYLCERVAETWRRSHASLEDGTPVFAGLGVGAFAEEAVVPTSAVVPLPKDVSLEDAALLGCAMVTGVGAIVNAARVGAGESVAVFGTGGVGLAAIQGARLVRANPIIAIDVQPAKEERARQNGATYFLTWHSGIAKDLRQLTDGRGVDHAFECVGNAQTIRAAWASTRRGGRTTVVGVGPVEQRVEFNPLELFHYARVLSGCVMGSSDLERDLPVLLAAVQRKELNPQQLVSSRIGLDDVPSALADMQAGRGARSLVVF